MREKRYDEEFKQNAVDLLLAGGRPLKPLARELGVTPGTLRHWRDAYLRQLERHPQGIRGGASAQELMRQLQRLRQENDSLRRQRDILKKALGILSEASPGGMP